MVSWYALLTVLLIFLFRISRLLTTPLLLPSTFFSAHSICLQPDKASFFYIFGKIVRANRLQMSSLKAYSMKETPSATKTQRAIQKSYHHQQSERWKRDTFERRLTGGYITAQDVVIAPVPVVGSLISSNHGDENASRKKMVRDVSILEIMTVSAPALHPQCYESVHLGHLMTKKWVA